MDRTGGAVGRGRGYAAVGGGYAAAPKTGAYTAPRRSTADSSHPACSRRVYAAPAAAAAT